MLKGLLIGLLFSGGINMAMSVDHADTGTVELPNGMPMSSYRLDNGLRVHIIENHSAPVFCIQSWFNVGSRQERLDPRLEATGLAHLFEHMMFRGTERFGDGEYDAILTRNGAHDINATTWFDRTNYYSCLPNDKLDLVLDLEADRMANLQVDSELLATEKGAVIGELHMGFDDAETVAYDKLYETAFTTHPYRHTTIGTEEEIRGFTVEDAEYFYRTYYSPGNAALLIVGDLDPANVLERVKHHYGDFPARDVPHLTAPEEPEQTVERQAVFAHRQLVQPLLIAAWHVPAVDHEDHAALWVLESLLATGRGSLLQEFWVNAGMASSVSGDLDQFKDPGLLAVEADVQSGRDPGELLRALDAALASVTAADYPLDRKVERARNQLLLSVYEQLEDNGNLASYLGEFIFTAGAPDFGFDLLERVREVTPADVLRVARRYLRPENRTIVIGRPGGDEE